MEIAEASSFLSKLIIISHTTTLFFCEHVDKSFHTGFNADRLDYKIM